jgi:acyl carrier protein
LRHPAIHDALILARENQAGMLQLVAYLQAEPDQMVTTEEIQRYLQKALPAYLVPSAYLFLDAFPLAATGKVDRQALPDPEFTLQDTTYEAPLTPIEETLATIWMQVLHVERVSRHDNFFALGGQSLLATQIISHVRRDLQTEMPLRTLFAAPTIASFAEAIIQQELAEAENEDLLQILAQLGELPHEN